MALSTNIQDEGSCLPQEWSSDMIELCSENDTTYNICWEPDYGSNFDTCEPRTQPTATITSARK